MIHLTKFFLQLVCSNFETDLSKVQSQIALARRRQRKEESLLHHLDALESLRCKAFPKGYMVTPRYGIMQNVIVDIKNTALHGMMSAKHEEDHYVENPQTQEQLVYVTNQNVQNVLTSEEFLKNLLQTETKTLIENRLPLRSMKWYEVGQVRIFVGDYPEWKDTTIQTENAEPEDLFCAMCGRKTHLKHNGDKVLGSSQDKTRKWKS